MADTPRSFETCDAFGASDAGSAAMRAAIDPIIRAYPVGAVPIEGIVAAGRRRERARRLGMAASGLALAAATALAVPPLVSRGADGRKPVAPAPAVSSSGPQKGKATYQASNPQTQKIVDILAALGPQRIGAESLMGHTWTVDVVVVPNELAFDQAHPKEFSGGTNRTTDPGAWYLITMDGVTGYSGESIPPTSAGPDRPFQFAASADFDVPNSDYEAGFVSVGVVHDPRTDHFVFVQRNGNVVWVPVTVGGHRFLLYTVLRGEAPTEAIAYDAAGLEVSRESGAQFDDPGRFLKPMTGKAGGH